MKRVSSQLIKDYLIVGCAWMCASLLIHPLLLVPNQIVVPIPIFNVFLN